MYSPFIAASHTPHTNSQQGWGDGVNGSYSLSSSVQIFIPVTKYGVKARSVLYDG